MYMYTYDCVWTFFDLLVLPLLTTGITLTLRAGRPLCSLRDHSSPSIYFHYEGHTI